jgi:hypothetical protein
MINDLNQLRPDKSVLSDQSTSTGVCCLTGLEELKPQLSSKSKETRIAILSQALKCGQPGKDWIYKIVKDETGPVQWGLYDVLWDSANPSARQKLLQYWPLHSEVGVDYTRLRDLLAARQWKEAEGETKKVMLKAAGREKEGLMDRESSENFPKQDLHTIDQLWVKFSNGRFGFSVQKRILERLVGRENINPETSERRHFTEDFKAHINEFGEHVGWRMAGNWLNFRDLTFDSSAPEGHLPSPSFATPCNGNEGEEQQPWGRWCVSFCFGGIKCGVLFLGWWSLLSRLDS